MPRELFLKTLDAIEEFKCSVSRENIAEGLVEARARGVRRGRPMKVNAYAGDVARLRGRGLTGQANCERAWHLKFEWFSD